MRKSGSFRDESNQTDMQIINVSPIQNGKHLRRHLLKKKKKRAKSAVYRFNIHEESLAEQVNQESKLEAAGKITQ